MGGLLKRIITVAAVAAAICAGSAHAEQPTGFYVAPQVGLAHRTIDDDTYGGTWNVLAYSLSAGYQVTKNVGLEVGWLGSGQISEKVGTATFTDKVTGFLGSVTGTGPINQQWGVLGRVGAIHYKEKAKGYSGSASASASDSDDKFFVSAGLVGDYDGGQITLELGRALGIKGASVTTLLFGVRWFTGEQRRF